MIDPTIQFCLLGSFALLFAISATEKYKDRHLFQAQIENYRLIPEGLIPVAALMLIVTEVVTATLLITKIFVFGVLSGMVLLSGYAIGIWINLIRGRTHIDCGCLGSHGDGISYYHVLRNLFLVCLLSICLATPEARPMEWLDFMVIIFFLGGSMLLYACASFLLSSHMNHRLWWQ